MSALKTMIRHWPPSSVAQRITCNLVSQSTTKATPFTSVRRAIHIRIRPESLAPKRQPSMIASRNFITTAGSLNASSPGRANTSDLVADAKAAREATSSPSHGSSAAPQGPPLDWNTFFALRTRRRWIQVAFSVISGITGMTLGAGFLATGLAEPIVGQIPLDPFVTLGLMVFACGGLGWLLGPSIGNQVFYLRNWRLKGQIQRKEAEFFSRVKRNRVDPSNSSYGNPVPDFYGEKISSVNGYRQWLKDQKAFNKKKTKNLV